MDDLSEATLKVAEKLNTAPKNGKNILILDFDLFATLGGGQTSYRQIIKRRSQDTFFYLRKDEPAEASRPANAVAIPMAPPTEFGAPKLSELWGHLHGVYLECERIARSVVLDGRLKTIDVIDVPDYSHNGLFIRRALKRYDIEVDVVALALHGSLRTTFSCVWPTGDPRRDRRIASSMRLLDGLLLRASDAHYALSESYAAERGLGDGPDYNLLDPLVLVETATPQPAEPRNGPPDLMFVGRREKWKGPDLFVDMAFHIDRQAYGSLVIAGQESPNRVGVGSEAILRAMARSRGLDVDIVGMLPGEQVRQRFEQAVLPFFPSRYDTFNLTALEALMRGCPTVVSSRTGFSRWLRKHLPTGAAEIVDIDCGRSAASAIETLLSDYEARRAQLVDRLQRSPLEADWSSVGRIYDRRHQAPLDVKQRLNDVSDTLRDLRRARESSRIARSADEVRRVAYSNLSKEQRDRARRAVDGLRESYRAAKDRRPPPFVKRNLQRAIQRYTKLSPRSLRQVYAAGRVPKTPKRTVTRPDDPVFTRDRLSMLSQLAGQRYIRRISLFAEMGRLERFLDNDLIAATYALRLMRWSDGDRQDMLAWTSRTLRAHGFAWEADTAEAMYGPPSTRHQRCLQLMDEAFARNRTVVRHPFARLDDRRAVGEPRVSVIVSLYNAADKLPTLLQNLAQQSIAHNGAMEIILIDSNSPTDEFRAFDSFAAQHNIPMVYGRSEKRETIQCAWNRGIILSRGRYLAFLGADEGLHPDALRQLADALDQDPSVDWVMADSIVTEVDANGVFSHDVMKYDRQGYAQDLVYLETCYLSWVGGLYRRSVHDRFGYYDETFRAAGDTEFKCRVLPYIRSKHVPATLGVFNNYPEARTTAHPRAEIEDLRAWYLWRTAAGVEYAFRQRDSRDIAGLFRQALTYRKSFCGHWSTDFDFAAALADHLSLRPDAPHWAAAAKEQTQEMLRVMRWAEGEEPVTVDRTSRVPAVTARRMLRTIQKAKAKGARHRELFELPNDPTYEIFNDNRYEQHWWSWSS